MHIDRVSQLTGKLFRCLNRVATEGTIFALACVLAVGLVGCDQQQPSTPLDETKPAATKLIEHHEEGSSTRHLGSLPTTPDAKYFVGLSPTEDGWTTESLHNATNAQLRQLAPWLASSNRTAAELGQLVSSDFVCSDLRPNELVTAVSGGAFTVSRAANSSDQGAESDYRGSEGLIAAANQLMRPLENASDTRVHFKEYKISVEGKTVQSTVLFQSFGKTTSGSLQQNAVWDCRWSLSDEGIPPQLTGLKVRNYEEVAVSGGEGTLFTDLTAAVAGHDSAYSQQLAFGANYWKQRLMRFDLNLYQGLALGDANGDGLDDLYVCQTWDLPNRLMLQNANGTVSDNSAAAGVDWLDASRSAIFVDLDNDGDQDLAIGAASALLLVENDGTGHFELRQSLPAARDAFSLAIADYDSDGKLDVYACCYYPTSTKHGLIAFPIPYHDAKNGEPNRLYRNLGDWKFKDVTANVGLADNNSRFSLAATWEDFDNDGDQDLYVANDFGRNNLYRNDGGQFVDVAGENGTQDMAFGMAATWGDYDHNGWMDLYVSNMFSSAGNRIAYQDRFREEQGQQLSEITQYMVRGNSLFSNSNKGQFQDVSEVADVSMGRWAWSSLFTDINNDGWEDLLVANGYVSGPDSDDL